MLYVLFSPISQNNPNESILLWIKHIAEKVYLNIFVAAVAFGVTGSLENLAANANANANANAESSSSTASQETTPTVTTPVAVDPAADPFLPSTFRRLGNTEPVSKIPS